MSKTPIALTIAGSDSGGGAGIQADLKTFAALETFGLSAITALTAQSTTEVRAVHVPPPDFLRVQLETLADDFEIAALKTGMLPTVEVIETVADFVERLGVPAVVDPVMVATSGARLIEETAIEAMKRRLVPIATLVTPNLPESALLGEVSVPRLKKGGHAGGPQLVDALEIDGRVIELRSERIDTRSTHGTGCTYAAAITAFVARGFALVDAVTRSHAYLRQAIESAPSDVGRGHGPVHHLHPFYRW